MLPGPALKNFFKGSQCTNCHGDTRLSQLKVERFIRTVDGYNLIRVIYSYIFLMYKMKVIKYSYKTGNMVMLIGTRQHAAFYCLFSNLKTDYGSSITRSGFG